MCLVILIPWWEMSHSHPCLIFLVITLCFSLIYPPRGGLSLKEPFKLVFTITAVLFHSLLPQYCSQWLSSQGSNIPSGLSSLPVFTWVVSFPQLSHTPQAHKPLCPCFTQVFTVFLASGCPCLPFSCPPQQWSLIWPITFSVSRGRLLWCQVHISVQIFPCRYWCHFASSYLAHLPFLVSDSIVEMWCNMM